MERSGSYSPTIIIAIFLVFIFQSCVDSTGPANEKSGQSYSHVQNPGTSANDFLADSNFTHLVVEVDYMPGYEPSHSDMNLDIFLDLLISLIRAPICRNRTEIKIRAITVITTNA